MVYTDQQKIKILRNYYIFWEKGKVSNNEWMVDENTVKETFKKVGHWEITDQGKSPKFIQIVIIY